MQLVYLSLFRLQNEVTRLNLLPQKLVPFNFAGIFEIDVVLLAYAQLHIHDFLERLLDFLNDLQVTLTLARVRVAERNQFRSIIILIQRFHKLL